MSIRKIVYIIYMNILVQWVISAVAIIVTGYLLPGVHIASFSTAFVAAVVLGIINVIIKPVLLLLTLPINILSLGLFTFVINAFVILLTSSFVPGFVVNGFWWALLFSVILAIVNGVLNNLST